MRHCTELLVMGLLIGSLARAQAPAQPQRPAAPEVGGFVFRAEGRLVVLHVTVLDKNNRFVTNLTQPAFKVYENGIEQSLKLFRREDVPVSVGFEQEAAIEFIRSVLKENNDKAFLVSYDTQPELAVDFTHDTEKLAQGVRGLRAGGGTALYDAIYFACRDKLPEDSPPEQFRRALVVLGDGDDTGSRVSREQALEMAHRAEGVIFTISTNRTGVRADGDKVLQRFSEQTGGLSFYPFQAADLSQSFANIANELRYQYFLLYAPNPFVSDGRFHEVEITTTAKDLKVRARKGYYAPTR